MQAVSCVSILPDLCVGGCCRVVGLLLLLTLLQLLFLHEGQLLLVLLVLLCCEHCGKDKTRQSKQGFGFCLLQFLYKEFSLRLLSTGKDSDPTTDITSRVFGLYTFYESNTRTAFVMKFPVAKLLCRYSLSLHFTRF